MNRSRLVPVFLLLGWQSFAADGTWIGQEFSVNVATGGHQLRPKVAAFSSDRFVVVWQSANDPAGRLLGSDGQPSGGEFAITSYITGHQQNARVAAAGSHFVVVWGSSGQDGDGGGIFGQRFAEFLFADGFESGDASSWSSSQP